MDTTEARCPGCGTVYVNNGDPNLLIECCGVVVLSNDPFAIFTTANARTLAATEGAIETERRKMAKANYFKGRRR